MTVSIPLVVTVQDGGGAPRSGVKVYAFNGATYTNFNGTTNADGQVNFTLPQGDTASAPISIPCNSGVVVKIPARYQAAGLLP